MSVHQWSLLISLFFLSRAVWSHVIHDALRDKIGAEEARYYTIESRSPVIVALFSDVGDADLYAAATHKNPTPSYEKYDVTSTSCGTDVIMLPLSPDTRKMTVGVHGHARYEETHYRLYVIEPSEEDLRKHQVWDWDPEASQNKLVIDVDPLVFLNDPALHELLEHLRLGGSPATAPSSGSGGEDGVEAAARGLFGWIGYVLLKVVEIAIEVFL